MRPFIASAGQGNGHVRRCTLLAFGSRSWASSSDLPADTRATSAIEFAIVAPVFGLLLAGAVDFGGGLYTKFALDGAVSAAGNYAILNAAGVSSSGGATLATSLASIVANGHAANWADATIVVNHGPSAKLIAGTITSDGTASWADSCYCPTGNAYDFSWGTPTSCTATCTGGFPAGKYVTIVASRTYRSLFMGYRLLGTSVTGTSVIGAGVVVQTQ